MSSRRSTSTSSGSRDRGVRKRRSSSPNKQKDKGEWKVSPEKKKIKNQRYFGCKCELRILIPSGIAGSIIGMGGKRIEKLRSQNNGVTICLPDSFGSPERIVSIYSEDDETTLNCLIQMIPFLEDVSNENTLGHTDKTDSVQEVRLLFHTAQAGCIIGKGGHKIKELRITTTTHIKVFERCCPGSTDRVVSITGSRDLLPNAIRHIVMVTLNDIPVKGTIQKYDARNFDRYESIRYGGFGEPRGRYASGGSSRTSSSVSSGEKPRRSEGDSRSRHSHTDGGRVSRNSGIGHSCRENNESQENNRTETEIKATTQVSIPNNIAGLIIGTGGSNIRRIRDESEARITIGEELPKEVDRIITISGTNRQIETAVYLLQQTVKNNDNQQT